MAILPRVKLLLIFSPLPSKPLPILWKVNYAFIIEKWGHLLGESFSVRILRGLDFLREDAIRIGTWSH